MTKNTALLVSLFVATTLTAQGPPPAPELKKLDMLAGAFSGEGVVRPAADAEPMRWTSRSTGRWILGGHALEEHMTVSFPGAEMPPIEFLSLFGWDGENSRYVNLGVSNIGPVELQPVHLISANQITIIAARRDESGPVGDHSAYTFGKDGYDFLMQRIDAGGKGFVHVKGSFKRVNTEAASTPRDASFQGEATGELGKLTRLLGTWTVTGKMVPAPGETPIPISGKETSRLGFGGQVIVGHVNGDPVPGMGPAYEEWSFLTWDAETKRYVHGYVNNMGQIGVQNGQAVGADTFVFTNAQPTMGSPTAARTTLDFSSGALHVTSDHLTGAGPAVRVFEGNYKPAK